MKKTTQPPEETYNEILTRVNGEITNWNYQHKITGKVISQDDYLDLIRKFYPENEDQAHKAFYNKYL